MNNFKMALYLLSIRIDLRINLITGEITMFKSCFNKIQYKHEIKKNNEDIESCQKMIDELIRKRDELQAKTALRKTSTKH